MIPNPINPKRILTISGGLKIHHLLKLLIAEVAVVPRARRRLLESQHTSPIQTLPPKQRLALSGAAEVVVIAAALLQYLRHLYVMTKSIRLPTNNRRFSKFLPKITLTIKKMSCMRLVRNQVQISFANTSSNKLPLSACHLLLYLLE